ncbi:hybrid sensor histidine kinase/response regulator transcription factor [Spirosoma fluviale]|uniref:hybrid sensor histidine kinase/response regulator transcription factor n=1 Tax=Spirosoma fluviale TaxID=1597977 RepID=UPI0015CBB6C4|nr:ATP-binding protein [Spirosoma fluviale]
MPHLLIHQKQTVWTRLFCCLLLIASLLTNAYAQHPPDTISLKNVPDDGFQLKEGWRFHPGDHPKGASPDLDDRHWTTIDPTKSIRELPQLQRAGIGWLRLHIRTGPELPLLMIKLFQSVASEIYLDGRLLYRFGKVSANPDSVQAYDPSAAYSFPLTASSSHLLALRVARQPSQFYYNKYVRWDAAAVQFWLFPSHVLPAIKPVDVESIYLNTFRVGIAFILFILHLSLFFAHHSQRANGYAAGMYLLLTIAFFSRFVTSFTHTIGLRILVDYGSYIDRWVPCLMVLTFYGLFNFRRGWLFWLAVGSVGLRLISLPPGFEWLSVPINFFLPLELIRLSLVAVRRGLRGAQVVTICAFCNLGMWILSYILFSVYKPGYGHEWVFHIFYLASFLCFPLTLSILLALEHGWVNGQLVDRIGEIETLSAKSLAQQAERQQLLAQQNEQLEAQVAERTQELRHQADQLRELDQVKSRFVNNLTHEFRTPLSLILSPVAKLLDEKRYDGSLLTLVYHNADKLLRLINQLLDLAKLEGNFMPVSLMQGDVTEFVHQMVAVFQRSAEQKGIRLRSTIDFSSRHEYAFDADKWEKILTNLLANAIKFTSEGGQVTLMGRPVWLSGEVTHIAFQLVDTGIGIAPEQLPHVFDRFYQVDNSSTRAYEGTGIGLALVNELVSLLGGTIQVESTVGVGTTFHLRLPVESVTTTTGQSLTNWSAFEPMAVESLPLPVVSSFRNRLTEGEDLPRILVVEDNAELRSFLVGELSDFYQVTEAEDGQAGWALTQSELPDIVITDVMMPRMDGYALTRLIKANTDTNHIAVVMLTAKTAQPSRLEGLQQGADDYLSKPFSVAELQLRVANLITRQQTVGSYYRKQFSLAVVESVILTEFVPEPIQDPFLDRIYELLDRYLDDSTIGVDWLADQLAMNRKTLYRKLQCLIQLSPTDLIRQYRLRKSTELLRAGYPVAEVSDLVGFNTPSHFALVFKEFYQQTPTEFTASCHKLVKS